MLRKIYTHCRSALLFGPGAFIRRFCKRRMPVNADGKVLIHIGCGDLDDPRYINVDSRPGWHIHHVGSVQECIKVFPPEGADLIYACHVLEHIPYARLPDTLRGLFALLKKGGILRLSVPDFDVILRIYAEKNILEDILPPLMGGQGYPANFHCTVFNRQYLTSLLTACGFVDVRGWDPACASYHAFDDWSARQIVLYGKSWPVSLNLEAGRPVR